MGLFAQTLHVWDTSPDNVKNALNKTLNRNGLNLTYSSVVSTENIKTISEQSNESSFIICAKLGKWVPIIMLGDKPYIGGLCNQLSNIIKSYVLAVIVHDDDVMLYNLDKDGQSLDGYNSNPQYFYEERISEKESESQRHTPNVFEPLVPPGKSLNQLEDILNKGWWQAHDNNRLDENGVMKEEDYENYPYTFESNRMVDIGKFFELAGSKDAYLFVDWLENKNINWKDSIFLKYEKKSLRGFINKLFKKPDNK